MTLTEAAAIESAGPELNAAVHRFVFGRAAEVRPALRPAWSWDRWEDLGDFNRHLVQVSQDKGFRQIPPVQAEGKPLWAFEPDPSGGWVPIPDYSGDIACAWRVALEMAGRGYTLDLQWKGKGRQFENSAEASFTRSIVTAGHAVGDLPGVAVCRAALVALLHEEQS